jgi:hypothetical protein
MTPTKNDPRLRLKEWIASGEARLLPLSFPQRELWENSPVPPGAPANQICASIEIRAPFSPALCEAALRAVVGRQEVLRTSFLSGAGRAAQVVRAKVEPVLRFRDIAPGEVPAEAMAAIFSEALDIVRGPAYRVELLRVAKDHHLLALVFHHAVGDGWTLGVFVEDFTAGYILALRESGRAFAPVRGVRDGLPAVALTYSAWAEAERVRWQPAEINRHAAYWRQRLEGSRPMFHGVGPITPLPSLCRRTSLLTPEITEATRNLARRACVTFFSALLTAFQIALFRWQGARDVVLGIPHANRTKAMAGDTMGYFAGVVPLRVRLSPDRPFSATLAANHAEAVEDFAHAMPFAELAAALGGGAAQGRHAIYDVRFALQNHPVPNIELPGVSTRLRTHSTGTSRFDIACELTEAGQLIEIVWLYRPSIVSDEGIRDLERLMCAVLADAHRDPDFRPSDSQ